jgi:threonylcarbamoyladenosine tRNA methylthiotransferase MtaB
MKTFLLKTLGCKVNQYESRQIQQIIEQAGLSPVAPGRTADIVIVNTCCVTHVASSKSRQSIRRAAAKNPDAFLVVTGCLPAGQSHELNKADEKCLIVKEKRTTADNFESDNFQPKCRSSYTT